jgi:hypothetical protein
MRSRQPFSGEDSDNESSSSDDSTASGTLEIETLTGLVKKLSLSGTGVNEDIPIHQNDDTVHQNNRFHGNCSPIDLVEATRQFKVMHLLEMTQRSRPQQSPASQPGMDVPLVGGLALRLDLWRTPYVSTSRSALFIILMLLAVGTCLGSPRLRNSGPIFISSRRVSPSRSCRRANQSLLSPQQLFDSTSSLRYFRSAMEREIVPQEYLVCYCLLVPIRSGQSLDE